jgi:hypothetical protein
MAGEELFKLRPLNHVTQVCYIKFPRHKGTFHPKKLARALTGIRRIILFAGKPAI